MKNFESGDIIYCKRNYSELKGKDNKYEKILDDYAEFIEDNIMDPLDDFFGLPLDWGSSNFREKLCYVLFYISISIFVLSVILLFLIVYYFAFDNVDYFLKGKKYKVVKADESNFIVENMKGENKYFTNKNISYINSFLFGDYPPFHRYFCSIRELRKMKLKKIKI